MNILFLMIPVTLILVSLFVYFFIAAAKAGQFEDLSSPPHRIFIEDHERQERKDTLQ